MHVGIYDYLCKFDMVNKSQFSLISLTILLMQSQDFSAKLAGNYLENNSYLIAVLVDFCRLCLS